MGRMRRVERKEEGEVKKWGGKGEEEESNKKGSSEREKDGKKEDEGKGRDEMEDREKRMDGWKRSKVGKGIRAGVLVSEGRKGGRTDGEMDKDSKER